MTPAPLLAALARNVISSRPDFTVCGSGSVRSLRARLRYLCDVVVSGRPHLEAADQLRADEWLQAYQLTGTASQLRQMAEIRKPGPRTSEQLRAQGLWPFPIVGRSAPGSPSINRQGLAAPSLDRCRAS